jgi:predicted MPP superfamily phosphohydrolase
MGPYFRKRIIKKGLTPSLNTSLIVLRQKEMGWNVLQNESTQIYRNLGSIGLCGVPYPPLPPRFPDSLTNFNPYLATRLLDTTQFNIMLCHTPIVWETMRDTPAFKRVDLILSGHSHAMQAKIETRLWRWSPARFMYKYWSGLYEHDGRYLYVNEGLGYVLYPMRIGGKAEITLITLSSK